MIRVSSIVISLVSRHSALALVTAMTWFGYSTARHDWIRGRDFRVSDPDRLAGLAKSPEFKAASPDIKQTLINYVSLEAGCQKLVRDRRDVAEAGLDVWYSVALCATLALVVDVGASLRRHARAAARARVAASATAAGPPSGEAPGTLS